MSDTSAESSIDFDHPPVAELALDEVHYRVDAGRGSAVAVSRRAEGSWTWEQLGEGKWDGIRLKMKNLDRLVVEALAKALRAAQESAAS